MSLFPHGIEYWFVVIFSYVSYIESQGGHLAGIVKITAPAEWEPNNKTREDRYNPSDIDVMIENPLRQTIKPTPTHGAFQSTSQSQPPISVENFVKLATSDRIRNILLDI